MTEKETIKALEDQARNTKYLMDRLNKAAYGTTWEEIIQAFADCVKLMNNLLREKEDEDEKPNY